MRFTDILIVIGMILFVAFFVALIMGDAWIPQLTMRLKLGRRESIARRIKEQDFKEAQRACWHPESNEIGGKYQATVVKRTRRGRVLAMYEIGNAIPVNDDDFPARRIEVFERARIRAQSLNSEI